jgi:hypothetical protein
MSAAVDKLFPALVAAQMDIEPMPRTADNPFFKSKYTDLAEIRKRIKETLGKHNLTVMQGGEFHPEDGNKVFVRTTVLHTSGQWMSSVFACTPAKSDPQGVGGAITYLKRYGLGAALFIVSEGEDDDGNRASDLYHKQASATARQDRRETRQSSRPPAPAAPPQKPPAPTPAEEDEWVKGNEPTTPPPEATPAPTAPDNPPATDCDRAYGKVGWVNKKPTAKGSIKYGIKLIQDDGEVWYNTFDAGLAEVAENIKKANADAVIGYKVSKYGNDVVSIEEYTF